LTQIKRMHDLFSGNTPEAQAARAATERRERTEKELAKEKEKSGYRRDMPLHRTYFHDITQPAKIPALLERLVDFERINDGSIHFSVNAVNVKSGEFVCFDNTTHRIGPEHVLASGSLPPYLPATEIDGEYYWDGALVSNTPLLCVLDADPHQDTLAFEVDLWNPMGELPRNLAEVDARQTEIQLASRNRAATAHYKHAQRLRAAMASLLKDLPDDLRNRPDTQLLAAEADEKVCNIVHLIYHAKGYEGSTKYNDYSRPTMEEHWRSGHRDAVRSLNHPDLMHRPGKLDGFRSIEVTNAEPY